MIKIKNYTEPEELQNSKTHPLLFKENSGILIVGPTGCGKTNLLINLINGFDKPKDLRLDFDNLYICAKDLYEPKYQKLIEQYTQFNDVDLKDLLKVATKKEKNIIKQLYKKYKKETFFTSDLNEFPTVDELDRSNKNLVIFDDCVTERDQKIIEDYFIRGRKKNAIRIYLSQSYYSTPINIRRNCNYYIFFSLQPRELQQIIREIDGHLTSQEFKKMFNDCDNFFMLDLVNPKMRYRNNFIPLNEKSEI